MLWALLTVALCVATAAKEEFERPADVNVTEGQLDQVLKNERVLKSFIKCLLGGGPCSKDGRRLKDGLPKLIDTECAVCNEEDKHLIRKAVLHLQTHKPAELALLKNMYDPQNTKLAGFLKAIGI